MSKTLKNRVAIAVGTLGLVWGSIANAAPLANVSGTWTIVGNQHVGSLTLSQGIGTPCAPINGTIYPGTSVSHPVRGYYCPATGRLAFARNNSTGVVIQTWVGNVSDVITGAPHRMGGTFHALDAASGSGVIGEYHFQGQK
ncbi:MAG: hypothetical protein FJ147_05340 [Deltaproteobacteria bacterium]|nr:hypothetical protein [Deltaproteobacteria bacterium]